MKAASDGKFKITIPIYPLKDYTVLTDGTALEDEDIRVFAQDYNLDYTPHKGFNSPVLSWNKQ